MKLFQIERMGGQRVTIVSASAEDAINSLAALSGASAAEFSVVVPGITTFWTAVQKYRQWVSVLAAHAAVAAAKDAQFPSLAHDGNLYRRASDGKVFRFGKGNRLQEQVRRHLPWGQWVTAPEGEQVEAECLVSGEPVGFLRDGHAVKEAQAWCYWDGEYYPGQSGRESSALSYSRSSVARAHSALEAIDRFERARPEIDEVIARRAMTSAHEGAWEEVLRLVGFRGWQEAAEAMVDTGAVQYGLVLHIGQQSGRHALGSEPGLFAY